MLTAGSPQRGALAALRPPARHQATEWRYLVYPSVLIGFLTLTVVSVVLGWSASRAELEIGGDFPAFYGAGAIVADGDLDELYDPSRQIEAQDGLPIGTDPGGLYFAYPPAVAVAFAPIGALSFLDGYLIYTLVLEVAILAALRIGFRNRPSASGRLPLVALITLITSPVWRSVLGSQTAAIYLLLISLLYRELRRPDPRLVPLGLILAGCSFKPQLGIPLIGLVALRNARNVPAAFLGGAIAYGANAVVAGPLWITDWMQTALSYNSESGVHDSVFSISFIGVLGRILPEGWGTTMGIVVAVAVGCCLVAVWRQDSTSLERQLGLAIPGIILMSPHAIFTEAALLVLVPFLVVDSRRRAIGALIGVATLSWMEPLAIAPFGVNPNFWLTLLAFVTVLGMVIAGRPVLETAIAPTGHRESEPRLMSITQVPANEIGVGVGP